MDTEHPDTGTVSRPHEKGEGRGAAVSLRVRRIQHAADQTAGAAIP